MSIPTRQKLGKLIGDFLRLLSKRRSNITLYNIKASLDNITKEESISIRNKAYHNLGITLLELLAIRTMKKEDIQNIIEYENIELIKENSKKGKGIILLSGHYGNWELLAYSAGLLSGVPVNVVVKPQKNQYADRRLNQYRTKSGNKILPMKRAAFAMISALKNNEAIALLVDQSAEKDKDIKVKFFGRDAITYEAPAALSLKFGSPIIMGFAERMHSGKYKVKLSVLPSDDLHYNKEGIRILTERHVAALEQQIRKKPEDWAWQHRRWKNT